MKNEHEHIIAEEKKTSASILENLNIISNIVIELSGEGKEKIKKLLDETMSMVDEIEGENKQLEIRLRKNGEK